MIDDFLTFVHDMAAADADYPVWVSGFRAHHGDCRLEVSCGFKTKFAPKRSVWTIVGHQTRDFLIQPAVRFLRSVFDA
jgi:hypothetical protein